MQMGKICKHEKRLYINKMTKNSNKTSITKI